MKIKKIHLITLMFLLTSLLIGCTPNSEEVNSLEENKELLIAAAASLTDVMEELSTLYTSKNPQTTIRFTFGSSGALQAQIEEGAPVDVFMSAAQKQMVSLKESNLMLEDTITTLLINKVVLITPIESKLKISSFEELVENHIKKIAIGDPGNVPVGQYSQEIFENLDLERDISSKLILANDVRTVLSWVESGEVDCGIVYATDAFTTDRVKIVAKAPEGSHKEVTYPVGVVKDSKEPIAAREFLDFLSTEEAVSLFEQYGFFIKQRK